MFYPLLKMLLLQMGKISVFITLDERQSSRSNIGAMFSERIEGHTQKPNESDLKQQKAI